MASGAGRLDRVEDHEGGVLQDDTAWLEDLVDAAEDAVN